MELAKPALDVGLYTNELDAMLAFWAAQPGVAYDEMLPLGGGVRQHRHKIGESILKINHSRHPLQDNPRTGLSQLSIPGGQAGLELLDPDRNRLTIVNNAAFNLCVHIVTPNLPAMCDFYGTSMGLPEVGDALFAVGASQIKLEAGEVNTLAHRDGPGYRYMTVQVSRVTETHRALLDRGATEGMAPVRLGDVAHISFVRDPDGNWLEISQRKSITGSLD